MNYLAKYWLGLVLTALAICGVIDCYRSEHFSWWALGGSLGVLLAAICAFVYPVPRRPFKRVYSHEAWVIDAQGGAFPYLIILAKEHSKGENPQLEFRQGDFVFPWIHDTHGNITIIRNNHSIGRFADLAVIIREEL